MRKITFLICLIISAFLLKTNSIVAQELVAKFGKRSKSRENRVLGMKKWNTYDVVCVDGNIKLSVNGKFVNGITNSSQRKGYICLEAEGSEIHFRNIQIIELP